MIPVNNTSRLADRYALTPLRWFLKHQRGEKKPVLTFFLFLSVCHLFLFCLIYVFMYVPSSLTSLSLLMSFFMCTFYPLSLFPFSFLSALRGCYLGGVSSGQSYPAAQYESGLQQRGQQREQPGHQPRTLLHTSWWVAAADRYPRGISRISEEKSLTVLKLYS